ncbi:formin-like protein 13 [Phragmites australis]|uniref:formin-like protein 13 n=1 Tax=Phragmites australis TaxID=29695 RepID=UPI002D780D16|nr:formin-like protein 13 [Phragmites australis]
MRGIEFVVSVAVAVAELLLSVAAAEDGGSLRRRSLHQPFFPVESPPPPPANDDSSLVPPPDAAAAAATGGGRSETSVTNAVAIALAAGLVALAVASYSCFLLWRRRSDGGGVDEGRGAKSVRAAAARVASDVGSSARHHRSLSPSSTASDAIYLDPLTTLVEVNRHRQQSPDLRPLALVKQPSPDLRPLPPLKRPAPQPPPPPASTPPMTTTGDSSDEDQATYYTAPKTAKSSFSRSTSQRSTLEQTVPQPPALASAPTPTPPPPPQANPLRPARPPPPPPQPRQRLLRPMPAESAPPAALANLALTNSPEPVQDRGSEIPDGHGGSAPPPKPPSLKPLHWDKLRAISGRTTVWDQVHNSDSFRVDEEAMESLFLNKTGGAGTGSSDQLAKRGGAGKQESRLLDPKRLQNVAIMLKSLNVISDDVIGALMHGNGDLGSEFYETLAKMAPTKEEELKLNDYSGDISRIDPAERFLKDILDVPFAFKRVDALLYKANFDNEVNYLRKSFGTLEAACADLRSSKLFLKLLDAVLKTGNRMNDGTNRGEARAFKLDTLLKLADIKSTDGKTTVLHFVVQEIIRSEGFGSDETTVNPGRTSKEQFKKDGLKVLAGLSSEISNVKRAATLEMDTLIGNVSRLETDLEKVKLVLPLKEACPDQGSSEKFFKEMDAFLERAQVEIVSVKTAGEGALRRVKETTEYFHGDATKEEPHHLRIFMVVSEFLSTLDRVCRDVGRTPERVMMGSGKLFRVTAGTSLPPRRYETRRELSSSDEDSSSS